MQSQQLPGSEPGRATPRRKKLKRPADQSGHEDPDDDDGRGGGERLQGGSSRKARAAARPSTAGTSAVRGLLREFFEQQLRLDVQRQEMVERQAQERMFFEQQWRQSMQRIERERLVLEQAWVQREEQRRMREEARAERRDALFTSLLTRLLQGDL